MRWTKRSSTGYVLILSLLEWYQQFAFSVWLPCDVILSAFLLTELFWSPFPGWLVESLGSCFFATPVGELPVSGAELGLSSFGNARRGLEEVAVCRQVEAELNAWLIIKERKGDTWELRTWVKLSRTAYLMSYCYRKIRPLASDSESLYIMCWLSPPPPFLFEMRSKLEV